jgi:hypothetical protein
MQTCTICKHKQRESIDRAIVENEPERTIADRYSVSKTAVHRHKAHITALVQSTTKERAESLETDMERAENRVESLYLTAEAVLKAAIAARDPRGAMQAIRTAVSVLGEARQLAELRGIREAKQTAAITTPIDGQLEALFAAHDEEVYQAGLSDGRAEVLAELQAGTRAVQ